MSTSSTAGSASDRRAERDFDIFSLFTGPANIMTNLFAMADAGRKTIAAVSETIQSLQRAAVAIERLTKRLDGLADEFETPLRTMLPEFEKAAERMRRLSDAFEGPVERLVPNLEQAIRSLDRVGTNQLPETLDLVREQLSSVLDAFGDVPSLFAPFTDLVPGLDRWFQKPRSTARATPASPTPERTTAGSTSTAKPSSKPSSGPARSRPTTTSRSSASTPKRSSTAPVKTPAPVKGKRPASTANGPGKPAR